MASRPDFRSRLAVLVTLAAGLVACSAPPPAATPPQADGTITAPAPVTTGKRLPVEVAPSRPPPVPAPVPISPPPQSSPPPSSPPPSSDDAPIPVGRPAKPARIEATGGVSVAAVLPLQCPTAGGQPFARWLASADAVDGRLTAAGVDSQGRAEVARLTVDWHRGERLLLVYGGAMPNPGHRLLIDSIARTPAGTLQVRGHRVAPPPGAMLPQVIVHPCQVIQLADPEAARDSTIEFSLAR